MATIEVSRLIERAQFYGRAAGASDATVAAMREMLASPLAARLLALPEDELHSLLVNDAYKIRMHQMYARYFQGAACFCCMALLAAPWDASGAAASSSSWRKLQIGLLSLARPPRPRRLLSLTPPRP